MTMYSKRDLFSLEPHLSQHLNAMLQSGLENPLDIAAELAVRDKRLGKALATVLELQNKLSPANHPDAAILVDNLLDQIMEGDEGHKKFIRLLVRDLNRGR